MKRSKRFIAMLISFLMLTLLFPVTAMADMGPKPSVTIEWRGGYGTEFYVTLLAGTKGNNGPWRTAGPEDMKTFADDVVFQKPASFADPDGYHFWCGAESSYTYGKGGGGEDYLWGYYPPDRFKILLYFPETDQYAVSEIYDRYAFDAYYQVDLSELELTKGGPVLSIEAERNYDYAGEFLAFWVRFSLTFLVELIVAFFFGYRKGHQLRIIFRTNLVTQVLLNVLLGLTSYYSGILAVYIYYVPLELGVFAGEAFFYRQRFRKPEEKTGEPMGHPVLYAAAANLISFGVGVKLSGILERFF